MSSLSANALEGEDGLGWLEGFCVSELLFADRVLENVLVADSVPANLLNVSARK